METEINIVEILNDKPQGTKLYSSACGKCKLEEVDDKSFKISFYNSKFGFMNGGEGYLDKNGKLYDDGECVVFPSKEMRNWSKFAWKKGDVLISNDGGTEVIFDKWYDDTYTSFYCKHYLNSEDKNKIVYYEEFLCTTARYFLEDKDTAQTYIKAIEEKLGGKLNRETLEIEKAHPKFKDGDIIKMTWNKYSAIVIFWEYSNFGKGFDSHVFFNIEKKFIEYNIHGHILKDAILRLATEEEKKKLFDALAKRGKAWDAEKKAIMDLKPKCEFKPFDKVLSRRCSKDYWVLNFYSHKTDYYHVCIDGSSNLDCIPYNEETAHLLGTTDNWEGGKQ